MTHETPSSSRSLSGDPTGAAQCTVLTARALREHGVSAATAAERCRPGGPWQMLLPGVCLLHAGPPTSDERLRAALLYADRVPVPGQPRGDHDRAAPGAPGTPGTPSLPAFPVVPAASSAGAAPEEEAMLTGLAALALYGFSAAPSLLSLDRIDVLVPHTRRLRSTGCARIVRSRAVPVPEQVTGLPVAPAARALADAVLRLSDPTTVWRLLTEAVRGGFCEAHAAVRELGEAGLLGRPHVVEAVDALLAEDRALAEGLLYEMVLRQGLPEPCWNVDLRLPFGPHLGGVDAYWPEQAVAVELDTLTPRGQGRYGRHEEALRAEYARKRGALEDLGITVVRLTPESLRESLERQAAVVRTALIASADRECDEHVVVRPR